MHAAARIPTPVPRLKSDDWFGQKPPTRRKRCDWQSLFRAMPLLTTAGRWSDGEGPEGFP